MASLPSFLLNSWPSRARDAEPISNEDQLKEWTTSSLAQAYLEYQLDRQSAALERQNLNHVMPSLSSVAVANILGALEISKDICADVNTIAESLPSNVLRMLVNDQRTSYQLLRAFNRQPRFTTTGAAGTRTLVDIDEAVLHNERYIRRLKDIDQKNKYIVSLEDFCNTLSIASHDAGSMEFYRKNPPKGGLEVLDAKRKTIINVLCTEAGFRSHFERLTNRVLRGLDWSNVVVAGGVALATLLQVSSTSYDTDFKSPKIKIYLHGVSADEANRKVEEIHDTWARNLPPDAPKLVVKSAKAIDLISEHPNRPIRIALKLYSSAIDILLDSDLDACAVGFDGSRVLMLPRCARAIETGYSVFSMDLVWGNRLQGRQESNASRLFNYAERGFGMRFLPSSVQSLKEERVERKKLEETSVDDGAPQRDDMERQQQGGRERTRTDRKPCFTHGKASGLQILKEIARIAAKFVCEVIRRTGQTWSYPSHSLGRRDSSEEPFDNNSSRIVDTLHVHLEDVDGSINGRREVLDSQGFEILMRYCEIWRLYAQGKLT